MAGPVGGYAGPAQSLQLKSSTRNTPTSGNVDVAVEIGSGGSRSTERNSDAGAGWPWKSAKKTKTRRAEWGVLRTGRGCGWRSIVSDAHSVATLILLALWIAVGRKTDNLGRMAMCFVAVAVATEFFGAGVRVLIWFRPNTNSTNSTKTKEQLWQLGLHIAMTWLNWDMVCAFGKEALIIATPKDGDRLWAEYASWGTPYVSLYPNMAEKIETIYMWQAAIWFVTAARHRIFNTGAKDYHLMYTHHVVTLFLVVVSFYGGRVSSGMIRVGAYVMAIHDSSDVVVDVVRLAHNLGLDIASGFPLAEVAFVTNLGTWAWTRLYYFPLLIAAMWVDPDIFYTGFIGNWPLFLLLCILLSMHIYWYYLFGRIGYKLLVTKNGHAAGREYEGASDSEDDDAP